MQLQLQSENETPPILVDNTSAPQTSASNNTSVPQASDQNRYKPPTMTKSEISNLIATFVPSLSDYEISRAMD